MTYTPKIGEDAMTRDGDQAVLVAYDASKDSHPYYYLIDGTRVAITSNGFFWSDESECGYDLIGPWVEPKEEEKPRLEWEKAGKRRTLSGCKKYTILKEEKNWFSLYRNAEDGMGAYIGLGDYLKSYTTKKAAKAAAQRDADSR